MKINVFIEANKNENNNHDEKNIRLKYKKNLANTLKNLIGFIFDYHKIRFH